MHKYLFKEGQREGFIKELDFEVSGIREVDRGWFNSSDRPGYASYLVLEGIDELDPEWKDILTQAIEVFEVIEVGA